MYFTIPHQTKQGRQNLLLPDALLKSTYLIRDNILSLPGTHGTVPTWVPTQGLSLLWDSRDSPYYPKVGTVPTIPGTVP
eukprot:scaffold8406_cov92-Skeletonema_menzelii.AAC.1